MKVPCSNLTRKTRTVSVTGLQTNQNKRNVEGRKTNLFRKKNIPRRFKGIVPKYIVSR